MENQVDWSYSNLIPSDQDLDLSTISERMPEGGESTREKDCRSRNFAFTINNPCVNIVQPASSANSSDTSDQFLFNQPSFLNCVKSLYKIKLCVWQLEQTSKGIPHIQG